MTGRETAPRAFDPFGPLPVGTTVLEASAGTGKTHTIASLAARYLAEDDLPVDQLMLVTFGRMATVELRERVRARLASAAFGLRDPVAARASGDPLLAHLAGCSLEEAAERARRLAAAVADFDAATITTTHGFCAQMLAGLGVAADVDADATLLEQVDDVVREVTTDLYVRRFGVAPATGPPLFRFKDATEVATRAISEGSARLEPEDAAMESAQASRRRLAEAVRDEVDRRKRHAHVLDYDDLLLRLRDALAEEMAGEAARHRLRSHYRVVLVDEFQDTDSVQWDVFRSAFHGHCTLVLIGDPKQAIYAFRGGDVHTYLLATGVAGAQSTLDTSWRSDAPLAGALHALMGGVALGDPKIVVHPVRAAVTEQRIHPAPAPLRLRVVTRRHVPPGRNGLLTTAAARAHIAHDLAADVVRLLESGVELTDKERLLCPGDVAVLVPRNEDAVTVRNALRDLAVPVVLTGTSSVFRSPAASDWLVLLSALSQPHRPDLARAAAVTCFLGWSAERLASADDAALEDLGSRLRSWADVLASRGVAALLEVVAGGGLAARVLASTQGERQLTDIRHVGQLMHEAATTGQLGLASLVEWLRERIADAAADQTEELSHRLDSDAEAVQVITVHRSKGLEFPVVYAPYLWDRWVQDSPEFLRFHDEQGARVLDVGGSGSPGWGDRLQRARAEEDGESLRLAYVALTRARSQVVTWWAPTANTPCAPLHRLLFGERSAAGELPQSVAVPDDVEVHATLQQLAQSSGGSISVEEARPGDRLRWSPPAEPRSALAVRRFGRPLDLRWTRTSYTGLTAGLHERSGTDGSDGINGPGVASEPEAPGTVDEPTLAAGPVSSSPSPTAGQPSSGLSLTGQSSTGQPTARPRSPMADLPVGAAFGTLVHEVLEDLDFTAADLRAALVHRCEEVGRSRLSGVPADTLADALLPALLTPLGPLVGGRALADIPQQDVLAEMEYEYPLAGGDRPIGSSATLGDVADLLDQMLLPTDPLRGYADDLRVPALRDTPLRGFLGGFLDAVLRVRNADGEPRFLVVDYKTNWLGTSPSGEGALTAWDYRPDALAAAMRAAHYPLQALLYAVAVHRFLRWRLPGYHPDRHFGGVLYLFLRGMCGPETPVFAVSGGSVPAGVFSWHPPPGLVAALSDLLASGGRP